MEGWLFHPQVWEVLHWVVSNWNTQSYRSFTQPPLWPPCMKQCGALWRVSESAQTSGETQLCSASGVLVNASLTPEGSGQPGLRQWTISALWIPSLPVSSYQVEVIQLQTFPRSSHELFWASTESVPDATVGRPQCAVKSQQKRAAKC